MGASSLKKTAGVEFTGFLFSQWRDMKARSEPVVFLGFFKFSFEKDRKGGEREREGGRERT